MAFQIPQYLLERLRIRRAEQRAFRQQRVLAHQADQRQTWSFIDTIRSLFSGTRTVEQVSQDYVSSMHAWQDEIEDKFDAFLLDPGMGPMTYLTSDGRVLEDMRGWDGDEIIEVTGFRAHSALIVGSSKTGIAELLELIPPPPPGASTCPKCQGKRLAEPAPGFGHEFPCNACEARGWVGTA